MGFVVNEVAMGEGVLSITLPKIIPPMLYAHLPFSLGSHHVIDPKSGTLSLTYHFYLTLRLLMSYIYIYIYIYMELLEKPEMLTSYIY